MNVHTTVLDPKRFGFFIKCLRTASNLSQEAVALVSNVDVRTVQRVEGGQPTNITTRRCLARGLGYDDKDVFEKPEFARVVNQLFDAIEKSRQEEFYSQYPGTIRIKAHRVRGPEDLERVAEANAYSFSCDADDVGVDAKEIAACLFDLLRDIGDVVDDLTHYDKLKFFGEALDTVRELEGFGLAAFWATRKTAIVGANWADKTPMPISIGYLAVVSKERQLKEMLVPERAAFG